MPSASSVLDASAILAFLQGEPGAERVEAAIGAVAAVGAVNWAEALSKLAERGVAPADVERDLRARNILDAGLLVIAVEAAQARLIAELRQPTRAIGLSLGDRACLALAVTFGVPVLTTERVWGQAQTGAQVELIR
jgi:PIN domain nuclease of toxin-antitoxin system